MTRPYIVYQTSRLEHECNLGGPISDGEKVFRVRRVTLNRVDRSIVSQECHGDFVGRRLRFTSAHVCAAHLSADQELRRLIRIKQIQLWVCSVSSNINIICTACLASALLTVFKAAVVTKLMYRYQVPVSQTVKNLRCLFALVSIGLLRIRIMTFANWIMYWSRSSAIQRDFKVSISRIGTTMLPTALPQSYSFRKRPHIPDKFHTAVRLDLD